MKHIQTIFEKKTTLTAIWEAQHPVMNFWIVISFVCLSGMYAFSYIMM